MLQFCVIVLTTENRYLPAQRMTWLLFTSFILIHFDRLRWLFPIFFSLCANLESVNVIAKNAVTPILYAINGKVVCHCDSIGQCNWNTFLSFVLCRCSNVGICLFLPWTKPHRCILNHQIYSNFYIRKDPHRTWTINKRTVRLFQIQTKSSLYCDELTKRSRRRRKNSNNKQHWKCENHAYIQY